MVRAAMDAAAVFYDPSKFERHGALPHRVIASLFGKRSVHTLDDEAHRQRKAAFMSLMSPARLDELIAESARHWRRAIAFWPASRAVSLFDEAPRSVAAPGRRSAAQDVASAATRSAPCHRRGFRQPPIVSPPRIGSTMPVM
jgi:hypothetical protein